MIAGLAALSTVLAIFLFVRWYRWVTHYSIKYIRGPPRKSWLLGNSRDIGYQKNVGDLDFAWVQEYGTVWRLPAPLASNLLVVADPKALQHMFHKSGYNYSKNVHSYVDAALIAGKSILSAHSAGEHSRHRKTMNPAFAAPQLRSFLPLFLGSVNKMSQMWKDEVLGKTPDGAVIAVNKWLARTTMDVIGEAGFDTEFGALDNEKSDVANAYDNLFVDSVLYPAKWNTVFRALWGYVPAALLNFVKYLPTREYARFRRTLGIINRESERLVTEKSAGLLAGDKSAKDIMSILVRANASEDPKSRLDDEEMISQMAAFILAGHETTASTTTWLLYELARHPEFQEKMRAEVVHKRAEVSARGDSEFTMEDLESMSYLQAALKETLRFHSIVYHLTRQAGKDDVLPLSNPIETATGEVISEIPIAAGQEILVSICAYNRLKNVWGEDADTWNPMRFLEGNVDKEVKLGMFGNLMTFSAGVRGCIGWRFSVIELQAFAAALLENFRFALPADKPEIVRLPSGIMSPMVKGRESDGVQMPLLVSPL